MRKDGELSVSPKLKFSILQRLLSGETVKDVAYEEGVHLSVVYRVRKLFPLFFVDV